MGSENNMNSESKKSKKGFSFKQLKHMSHMEMVSNYFEYPQKNLKFKHKTAVIPPGSISKNTLSLKNVNIEHGVAQSKFLSEQEKADGWRQKFSTCSRFSKFL